VKFPPTLIFYRRKDGKEDTILLFKVH